MLTCLPIKTLVLIHDDSLKRRFEQNQNDCTFTIMSLLPTLSEQIFEDMAVEELWAKLQNLRKEQKQRQEQQLQREKEGALAKEKAALEQKEREEEVEEQSNTENVEVTAADQQPSQEEGKPETAAESTKEPTIETTKEPTVEPKLITTADEQPKNETTGNENIIESSISSLANSSLSEGSELSSSQAAHLPSQDKIQEQKSKYELWEEIKIKSKDGQLI